MAKRSAIGTFSRALGLRYAAGPREIKPGWNFSPNSRMWSLAAKLPRKLNARCRSSVTGNSGLVERIGRRLVATGMAGDYPYSFKVVNDPSINAFALPGGPTFVTHWLLKAADNEAQVAGVMAHEISHVALRHGTHQASKANLIQLPAMLAGAVVGSGSMLGQLAQLGIGLGANSVLLKFSRDAESEADILGARMMAQAGYNPIEMARFFEKLEAQGGRGGPQFLSDHPNPGNRMRAIQEEIQYMPQKNYTAGTDSLRDLQSKLGSLPAPSPQRGRSGAVSRATPTVRPDA